MFEKFGKIKEKALGTSKKVSQIMMLMGVISSPLISEAQNISERELTYNDNIELSKSYLKNVMLEVEKQNRGVVRTFGENLYTAKINEKHVIVSRDNGWVIACTEDGKGFVDLDADGKVDRFVNIVEGGSSEAEDELQKRLKEKGVESEVELESKTKEAQKLLAQSDYGLKKLDDLKKLVEKMKGFNMIDVQVIDFEGNVVNYIDLKTGEVDEVTGEDAQKTQYYAQETYTGLLKNIDGGILK